MAELPRRFGPYALLKRLGQGGVGEVYLSRALQPTPDLPDLFVIKVLQEDVSQDKKQILRFRHEAELAVAIDNPRLPRMYAAGTIGDALYIAMSLVRGISVFDLMARWRTTSKLFPLASGLRLVEDYLSALHALHTACDPSTRRPLGIVHRDLSPKNVMIDELGNGKLIDLGLCRSTMQDWATQAAQRAPRYAAPEHGRGEELDHRADLYSLGAVMFELLTGVTYTHDGFTARELRPDVPETLDRLLTRLMAPRAADRFLSAEEALTSLAEVRVPADPDGTSQVIEVVSRGLVEELETEGDWAPTEVQTEYNAPQTEARTFAARPELTRLLQLETKLASTRLLDDSKTEARSVLPSAPSRRPVALFVSVLAFAVVIAGSAVVVRVRGAVPEPTPPPSGPRVAFAPQPSAASVEPSVPTAPVLLEPEQTRPTTRPPRENRREPARETASKVARIERVTQTATVELEARIKAARRSDNSLEIARIAQDIVTAADRLPQGNDRTSIRNLAAASVVASDFDALERCLRRLRDAERERDRGS